MNTIKMAISSVGLFLALNLAGQQASDIIHLRNGSRFEGQILEKRENGTLRFQLSAGGELEFREEEISRIEQKEVSPKGAEEAEGSAGPELLREKTYAFKERGVFNATFFSTLSGAAGSKFQLGLGIHNVTGYQFHRLLGIGLGLGVDTYSFDNGETLHPVFAEARGYLSRKSVSPYYSGSAGYGFAFKSSDELINKAEGGMFFRGAMGLRLGADKDTNVLADIGYQYQEAFFERRTPFLNEIEEKWLRFHRIVVRVGLIF